MSHMSEVLSYPMLARFMMIFYPSPTLTNVSKPEQHGRNEYLILYDTFENENMYRFMSSSDGCF